MYVHMYVCMYACMYGFVTGAVRNTGRQDISMQWFDYRLWSIRSTEYVHIRTHIRTYIWVSYAYAYAVSICRGFVASCRYFCCLVWNRSLTRHAATDQDILEIFSQIFSYSVYDSVGTEYIREYLPMYVHTYVRDRN